MRPALVDPCSQQRLVPPCVSSLPFPPPFLPRSNPEKLACCEQCLALVAALLWAPGRVGRDAAHAADASNGLWVLLRALLAGAELAEASAADNSWQVRRMRGVGVPVTHS